MSLIILFQSDYHKKKRLKLVLLLGNVGNVVRDTETSSKWWQEPLYGFSEFIRILYFWLCQKLKNKMWLKN